MKKGLFLVAAVFFCFLTISPATFAGGKAYPSVSAEGIWAGTLTLKSVTPDLKEVTERVRIFLLVSDVQKEESQWQCGLEGEVCSWVNFYQPIQIFSDRMMMKEIGEGRMTLPLEGNCIWFLFRLAGESDEINVRLFYSPLTMKGGVSADRWGWTNGIYGPTEFTTGFAIFKKM